MSQALKLDLNNPVFQKQLFDLAKEKQLSVLKTLRKLSNMIWNQVYQDQGLKWELVYSRTGPNGKRLYSLRIGTGFRAVAYRDGQWLRLLSLHPDHDSAYKRN
ncbi:MAG: hypothetical protein JRJ86_00995 [Deltaproteobacteria bacterium]|nr:hypothetical protein [Deltaproteobacteria bacterium]MBW2117708.1 hypothetical protein [Deltaproteobacteria bacterium]MBW2344129.1 hypothetical protein [Deltaproteobacteria bacterium]